MKIYKNVHNSGITSKCQLDISKHFKKKRRISQTQRRDRLKLGNNYAWIEFDAVLDEAVIDSSKTSHSNHQGVGLKIPVKHFWQLVMTHHHAWSCQIPRGLPWRGADHRPDIADRTALSASSTSFWKSSTGFGEDSEGFGDVSDLEERLDGSEGISDKTIFC